LLKNNREVVVVDDIGAVVNAAANSFNTTSVNKHNKEDRVIEVADEKD
jgi:hypothetical protein